MMGAKGAIQPVYQVMAKSGQPWTSDAYLSTVTGYYTTADGKMLSMPFNSSTPVLYYNVEAFQKAGLDPDKPPKTWTEVGDYARKLVKAGYPAGFSTAWISWIHVENFSAWHNVPIGTKSNGFEGLDTEFVFNSSLLVKHIQQLADWQKEKVFVYGGRRNKGNALVLCRRSGHVYGIFGRIRRVQKDLQIPPSAPVCSRTGRRQPALRRTPSSAAPASG